MFTCACVRRAATVSLSTTTTHDTDKPWTEENNYLRIDSGAAKRSARKPDLTTSSNETSGSKSNGQTDRQIDGRTSLMPCRRPWQLHHTRALASWVYTLCLKTGYFLIMPSPTIVGGGRPSVRLSVCPFFNIYFAWRNISVLSGRISLKLGTNIHHVSGRRWNAVKITRQRLNVKVTETFASGGI